MIILRQECRKIGRQGLRRKGFTLLELLAVLVILAALATIAIPIFINKSNEAKQVAHNENMRTLQNQAQMYMLNHESVADQDDIIDAMVAEGLIKERPKYPINLLNTYAVQVVAGIPIVKLNGPVAPTLLIEANTSDTTNATSITYTFTFNVPVTGFEDADITVTNGTPAALEGSGAVYTMVVTNTGVGQTQSISVPDGAAISTLGVASIAGNKDIVLANTVETIVVGDYIKFGKYLTKPIVWRVIGKEDINSDGTQELMLFSDKIISLKAFDAKDAAEAHADRRVLGNNNWDKSNLREWLNSTSITVAYSTQKPENLKVTVNQYDTEAGFVSDNNFTEAERDKIIPVTHKSMISSVDDNIKTIGSSSIDHTYDDTNPSTAVQNYDAARYKDTSTPDSVFILSIKELNNYVYNNNLLIDRTTYHNSYVTTDALTQSNSSNDPVNDTTSWYYWIRDAYAAESFYVRRVNSNGMLNYIAANDGNPGVRPAVYLSSSGIILGTESGATAATAYTITNLE
ncbi:MAG TPA: hypothetical protein DCP90_06365 [Clostridiales bacterium]|nr:MAG: hypothetical protein A2Y22_00910 [Clostridiales bacterium GWD2_32_59]HAN10219.1 hypothetical protein [Clostridiales bacterium]